MNGLKKKPNDDSFYLKLAKKVLRQARQTEKLGKELQKALREKFKRTKIEVSTVVIKPAPASCH